MRIEAFIQARMGSTRFPGKVLKPVLGKPLLDFLVERLAQSKEIDRLVLLTTRHPRDDVLVQFCQERQLACFRGSEEDVLDRFYQAALERQPEGIVRITADCPLIDPLIVDEVIQCFRHHYPHLDYVSNGLQRTYPRGLDVEVFTFQALQQAFIQAHRPEEREHVTVYLYRHPTQFQLKNLASAEPLAHHRWTVDTPEDFALIARLLEHLYPHRPHFRLKDVLELLHQHPSWSQLNAHIEQKTLPSP